MEQQAKYTGWFVLGAGVGMAVAMLLAPTSGQETRRRIKDHLSRARNTVEETADKIAEELEEARENPPNRIAKSKVLEEGLNHISEK